MIITGLEINVNQVFTALIDVFIYVNGSYLISLRKIRNYPHQTLF